MKNIFFLLIICFINTSYQAAVKRKPSSFAEENKTEKFTGKFENTFCYAKPTKKIITDREVDEILFFKRNGKFYERIYDNLTPEMFGAKGDGKTDDYMAIQSMLDKGEKDCTFVFLSNKIYYNAFANKGNWIDPFKRNIWQRHEGATFLFNNSKFTRRLAKWNDLNQKNDYNEGIYYTDDHSSLLYLTGNNYKIDKANFDSNVPVGNLYNTDGSISNISGYAVGSCMEMGLWLDKCSNVKITNSKFSNSVFPLYFTNCKNVSLENITIKYAAQAASRINANDQALGGGVKLINCNDIKLLNIQGYRNLNDTVEIETLNRNITVQGQSDKDYSNSLVIISSQNIDINWKASNIMNGSGVLITGGVPNNVATGNIKGQININGASWCGVLIKLGEDTANNINKIDLKINTQNTGYTGLLIDNQSKAYSITDVTINHNSVNDGKATGFSRLFNNSISGNFSGTTTDSTVGLKITGKNTLQKSFNQNFKMSSSIKRAVEIIN